MAGPLDKVLDAFVYVPVGLAMSAKEALPDLAARGRERLASARIIGQFAVQQGQVEASKLLDRFEHAGLSVVHPPAAPVADEVAPSAPVAPPAPTSGPGSDGLAIPGYDSLSASQVLRRLDGLDPVELEAVRAYEAAHRGRKTILTRIGQLQAR
jgi:hypothetical protein